MSHITKKLRLFGAILFVTFSAASTCLAAEGPIAALHDEVLTHTFSYLPKVDLGRNALVSTHFKAISEQDALWKNSGTGISTKKAYVEYITKPIVGYNVQEGSSIAISLNDLFYLADSSRLSVNGAVYEFAPPRCAYERPKIDLIRVLTGIQSAGEVYSVILSNNKHVNLNLEGVMVSYDATFQIMEADNAVKLIAPTLPESNTSFGKEENAGKFFINRLNCKSKHYDDCGFGRYWGYNNAFDALESELHYLYIIQNEITEVKNEAINFFIQKYIDFRKKDSTPWGDGYYANIFRQSLANAINSAFGPDFLIPEDIS